MAAPRKPLMRPHLKRLLDTLCVSTLLVFFMVIVSVSYTSRQREIDSAVRDASTTASALELYASGFVTSADLSLLAANESLRANALHRAPSALSRDEGNRILADTVPHLGVRAFLRVFDRESRPVFSSDNTTGDANVADRDYYRWHLEHGSDSGLFVSSPLVSRATGLSSIVFSRRRSTPNGEFDGVIVLGVPTAYFDNAFHRFDGEAGSLVMMTDLQGRIYARYPVLPTGNELQKADFNVAAALQSSQSDGGSGVLRMPADRGDTTDSRVLALRQVGSTPLVVMVGRSVDAALADWKRRISIFLPIATLLGLGAALMFMALTRSLVAAGIRSQDLDVALAAARDAGASQSRFLAAMSHELMTPLNGIYGAVQLWLLSEQDERRRSLGDMAKRSTERLQRSLNDALEYADVSVGTPMAEVRRIDLQAVLRGAVSRVRGETDIQTDQLRLPANPPGEPIWVEGDTETLHSVIWRLLDVSLRSTQGDSGSVQVAIDSQDDPGSGRSSVRLRVKAFGGAVPQPGFAKTLALFADSGDTESKGLYGLGVSLEIARLRALTLGAQVDVVLAHECLQSTLTLAAARPPEEPAGARMAVPAGATTSPND
ncbi:MAG: hybrid sensor histidine kinase/response regulator [Rhizobacter sp.]|nr:hybrid sensor histidine kinase/response regulator [Rhizobacter sp.]